MSTKIGVYKTIAIAFIIIAAILMSIIVFVSLSSATITVYPKKNEFISELLLLAKREPTKKEVQEEHIISYEIQKISTSVSDTFLTTGDANNMDLFIGSVMLVNESTKSQKLIKSTRLQTKEGDILRISEDIMLKPGERVFMSVYADDLESLKGKTITAQKLIIPGLWAGVREMIYGQVSDSFVVDPENLQAVSVQDIDMAEQQLREKMQKNVIESKSFENEGMILLPLKTESFAFQPSAEVGTLAHQFDALISGEVTVAILPKESLRLSAWEMLKKRLRPSQSLLKFDDSHLTYEIVSYNEETKELQISAHFIGNTTLAPIDELIEKEEIMGKSKNEIEQYFNEFSNIDKIEIHFIPSWMVRTPLLGDHVQVVIGE